MVALLEHVFHEGRVAAPEVEDTRVRGDVLRDDVLQIFEVQVPFEWFVISC